MLCRARSAPGTRLRRRVRLPQWQGAFHGNERRRHVSLIVHGGGSVKRETVVAVGGYVFPVSVLALLVTPAILTYQIYYWLRWGDWQSIAMSDALRWAGAGEPHFAWAGVQKISDLVMALPFSAAWFFVVLGLLVGFIEWA